MVLRDNSKEIIIEGKFIKRVLKRERINSKEEKLIIPGFIDSHTHLIHEGLSSFFPDLYESYSLDEAIQKVLEFKGKDLPFILALNFDESKWKEKKLPTKKDLDKISKDKPVIFRRICGHLAVTNTKGLEKFINFKGVDKNSGIMREFVPLRIFSLLSIPDEIFLNSLEIAIEKAIRNGITTCHEIVGRKGFYYFLKLKEKNKLKIKIRYYAPYNLIKEIEKIGILRGFGDDYFKFCGVKIFADGSIGSKKASISFNYKGERKRGQMLISKKEFQKILKICEDKNFQLAIHAIGDRAIKNVINWSKEVIKKTDLRHRIEHAEMIDEESLEEINKISFTLSIQPNFIKNWQFEGGMYEERLGKEWIYKMNPLKTMIEKGVKIGFGSDCMPFSPLYGIEGALSHPSERERIDFFQALKIYTKGSAFLSFDENKLGEIKENYPADIVILKDKKIEKVIIDGEIKFSQTE